MAPDTTSTRKPIPLIWLQCAHLLVLVGMIVVWNLLVSHIVMLPEDLASRVRGYPVFIFPIIAIVLIGNQLLLFPLYRDWQKLITGQLEEARVLKMISRAARYPYHAFTVPLLGIVLTTVVIVIIQAPVHSTPTSLVLRLMALVCTHAVAIAMISFGIGRIFMRRFLEIPGIVTPGFSWEPDLRKRLVLGVVCTVIVAWTVMGVMVVDRQISLAIALTGTDQHATVGMTTLFLVTAGPLLILMCGLASWFLARDISKDTESVIVGMETLAAENLSASTQRLPVLSLDELGDLIEAFNRLAERLTKHDRLLRKGAADASEADRRQMEFLAVVSHDLRTPLHSITGFGELLLEGSEQELSPEQREDVTSIQKASHHLLRLVDDVVDFSKIETGLMELTLREVDIGEVVRQALATGSGLRTNQAVRLASQVPHNLPAVRADETRLKQVLFHLVGNALKFTQQGEVLVIVGPEEDGMLEVAVSDSGPGIPPSKLDRVFEEFEQVRMSDISTVKGTGLGLAISRKLIQMHGGKIRVANRPQGGAVFSFTVPVAGRQESSL